MGRLPFRSDHYAQSKITVNAHQHQKLTLFPAMCINHDMKRYHLQLPDAVMDEIQAACKAAHVPLAEVIRVLLEREILNPTVTGNRRTLAKEEILRRRAENVVKTMQKSERDKQILASVETVPLGALAAQFGMTKSGICKVVARARKREISKMPNEIPTEKP